MRHNRFFLKKEENVYHLISRTSLRGYVLEQEEKDFLLNLTFQLSSFYFMDIIAFCIMGNHFHIMVRNKLEHHYSDQEILRRLYNYYPKFRKKPEYWKDIFSTQIPFWRKKMANLSEFTKDLKQRFSRYFNKKNERKGYFWGDRFKSVLLEEGKAVRNCIAYVDLNPVRANLVEKPEDYPWSSIYLRKNPNFFTSLLSKDFHKHFSYLAEKVGETDDSRKLNEEGSLKFYLKYLYTKGVQASEKGKSINKENAAPILNPEENLHKKQKLFSESLVLGKKSFLEEVYQKFRPGKVFSNKPRQIFKDNQDYFCFKGPFRG